MNIFVMPPHDAGMLRFLCAALVWLFCCVPVRAAELHWEKLTDRERLSMRFGETEGLPGTVGRIALTGIVVPFTRIPSGVRMDKTPEGATLFKGTRIMGQALVVETQTPEFGFVVSRRTPTELDIDLFVNSLGARWKPTSTAPTTEIAPSVGVREPEQPDAATDALSADPQGIRPETTALMRQPPTSSGGETAPQAMVRAEEPPAPGAGTPPPASAAQPAPPAAEGSPFAAVPPAGQRPVVVSLSGTPDYAAAATQMAQAPPAAIPGRGLRPRSGGTSPDMPPNAASAVSGLASVLNAPEERTVVQVSAPEPPLSVSESIRDSGAATVSGESVPSVAVPPAAAPPAVPAAAPGMPPSAERERVETPSVPPAPPTATSQPAPPTATPQPAPPTATSQPVPPATTPRPASSAAGPGVGLAGSGGVYGGLINTGGFEDIGAGGASPPEGAPPSPSPAAQSLSGREAPAGSASGQGGQAPPVGNATVVYTDAEGREIPPPPDPVTLMPEIEAHVRQGEFPQALEKATLLLTNGIIERDLRERLLHLRAEMLYAINKDDFAGHYLEIADATNQAMNFNQNSPRNAEALLRLGYMDMKVNNIAEAEARFNMLRRKYPENENVPLTYYYWGEYHFERNEIQKAADEFQYLLQEYPNSRYARDAALGLARSFYRLGYYDQAFSVVDYVERRWERFYLDYPPFLNMMGDIAFRLRKLDDSLQSYWLYMNLQPAGEETDIILTRIGDIYSMKREKAAAKELYSASVERFPGKDGALVAMMRLAEDGMNDNPSIAGMFSVFEAPFSEQPVEVYRAIIGKHPGSALVPLAEIKLALWHLWNKQYDQTLNILSAFVDKYPKHELAPRAKEIMLQAFSMVAAEGMQDQRFGKMRDIWEKYPAMRGQAEAISPESRVALATSYKYNGKPNEALEILEPLFFGEKVQNYSEMALSLVLSIYLEYGQWQSIPEVARRIELWELTPEIQVQLDYAVALAGENQGNSAMSAPVWQRLYDSGKLSGAQLTYATFFLARDAEKNRNLEAAFFLGKEALSRLMEQVDRTPNAADVGKIQTQLASLMDVSETAGRLREALAYAGQYLQYLTANDPERMAVHYRMARIYKKQGDNDNWQKTLAGIVAQDPASVYGQLAASELNAAAIAKDASQFSTTGRI